MKRWLAKISLPLSLVLLVGYGILEVYTRLHLEDSSGKIAHAIVEHQGLHVVIHKGTSGADNQNSGFESSVFEKEEEVQNKSNFLKRVSSAGSSATDLIQASSYDYSHLGKYLPKLQLSYHSPSVKWYLLLQVFRL